MMACSLLQTLSFWWIALSFTLLHGGDTDTCDAVDSTSVLENADLNQGLAFTAERRRNLGIDALLPFGERDIHLQSQLVMQELNNIDDDFNKYRYLLNILESNMQLFYYTLIENLHALMPIVYTPTVGTACQQLSRIMHRFDHGLWLNVHDTSVSDMERKLRQWRNKDEVKAIVVTDGERILGLGDLGANGFGISLGKTALYTAIGGIRPSQLLSVVIDAGTNNEKLLNDPFYIGIRKRRDEFRSQYDTVMDAFMQSVVNVYGNTTLVQFEDFGNSNAFRLLQRYQHTFNMFNDDIQGTAAVTMAGIYASLKSKHGLKRLRDHTFLLIGAGSAGIGIADIISTAIVQESTEQKDDATISFEEANKYTWLVDSKGLIYAQRKQDTLSSLKQRYAHSFELEGDENLKDIAYIVSKLGITAIIGVSGVSKQFTQHVVEALKKNTDYPLIFSLSNPTANSECTAQEAYGWAKNELFFASGSPFALRPDTFGDGELITPSQGNNAYIFPGVALGLIASQAFSVPNEIFLIAAQTVASLMDDDEYRESLEYGVIYPPIRDLRKVSVEIAIKVAETIHTKKLTQQNTPSDFKKLVTDLQFDHRHYIKL